MCPPSPSPSRNSTSHSASELTRQLVYQISTMQCSPQKECPNKAIAQTNPIVEVLLKEWGGGLNPRPFERTLETSLHTWMKLASLACVGTT